MHHTTARPDARAAGMCSRVRAIAGLTALGDNARMTGRRARPVGGRLVGLANAHAVNRGSRQAPRQLAEHALFGVRPRNLVAFVSQVVAKGGDDLLRIQGELNQAFIEIEEVAILVPLEKRADL